jgi:hypothetical protein
MKKAMLWLRYRPAQFLSVIFLFLFLFFAFFGEEDDEE